MLVITIEGDEFYDDKTGLFETVGDVVLELEHSLVSLSKWESKHQTPFLSATDKTNDQIMDYINFMVLTKDFDKKILNELSEKNIKQINDYIESPESATTFGAMPERRGRGEVITSELIYYWLVAFNVPFECEHWHINRLFALIRICNIKNSPGKKMPRHEVASRNRDLNAQRKAKLGTTG